MVAMLLPREWSLDKKHELEILRRGRMRQYTTSAPSESKNESASLAGRFSYEAIDRHVANFLKGQADRIRHQCVTSIIQIGKALLEAKRHLSHGVFLSWVEDEVRMPVRTAQTYMRVATWAEEKGATVAHLSPTVLYLLSAPSTPPELTTEVLAKAEAGELVAPATVRQKAKGISPKRMSSGKFESRGLATR